MIPLKLTIDANVINARGKLSAMNTIERWRDEGKVIINATTRLEIEIAKHPLQPKANEKVNTLNKISEPGIVGQSFFGRSYFTKPAPEFFPDFKAISLILFNVEGSERLNKNKANDVMHLLSHIHGGGDIFVTKNTKDFINKGKRESLLKLGVKVMTPEDVVSELQLKFG